MYPLAALVFFASVVVPMCRNTIMRPATDDSLSWNADSLAKRFVQRHGHHSCAAA